MQYLFGNLVSRTLNIEFFKSQSSPKFNLDCGLNIGPGDCFVFVSVHTRHAISKLQEMLFGDFHVTKIVKSLIDAAP